MNPMYLSVAVVTCYANDNSALIPEVWAQLALSVLEENMVATRLVHRDFSANIAKFGDVVNCHRPTEPGIRRKRDGKTLQQQDAVSDLVRVPLDQWFYSSFTIKDGEGSMAFKDLVSMYLKPHAANIARAVDRAVLGRVHEFLNYRVGRLGNLTAANSKDYVLEARETLNVNRAMAENRSLILSPTAETSLLKNELFIRADKRGDGGNALEAARLGHILGFDTYMGQNVNSCSTVDTDVAVGTVTNALAAGGSGSQATTLTGYNVVVGEFATVAGNDQPTIITASTPSGGDTNAITLNEANKFATLAAAVLTVYKAAEVHGDYLAGHEEEIAVDHNSGKRPKVGQLMAFDTDVNRHTYTIIETQAVSATRTNVWLDRPLVAGVANDDPAFPGPAGSFNWAMHRETIALVSRPLALPTAQGVNAGIAVYNDIAMRVLMQYDINAGGTIVNFDILAGVAKLDERLAVALLA